MKMNPVKTGSRGQASIEQLFVVSLGVALILILSYVSSGYATDTLRASEARDAVNRIGAAADYVYSLGPNSRTYVDVYLPDGIRNITISGRMLVIRVDLSSGVDDIAANTNAQLIGAIPSGRGMQKIVVEYLETGQVAIGESGLACSPSLITKTFNMTNISGSDVITITNEAGSQINNITATFSGNSSVVHITSLSPNFNLSAGGAKNVTVSYQSGTPVGTYSGEYVIETGNDGACIIGIIMYVNTGPSCDVLCANRSYSNWRCLGIGESCNAQGYSDLGPIQPCDINKRNTQKCCCGPARDIMGPIATNITISPASPNTTSSVNVTLKCDETNAGSSYVASAWFRMNNDTSFRQANATMPLNVNASVAYAVPGTLLAGSNIVQARCTDTFNNNGTEVTKFFNVTG